MSYRKPSRRANRLARNPCGMERNNTRGKGARRNPTKKRRGRSRSHSRESASLERPPANAWIGPLQSMDECHRHGANKVGILAHRFFCASPARIAAQVGVGRAHHDSAEIEDRVLVVVARLFSFERADLLHQRRIPGLAQALFLGKGRRRQRLAAARPPPARTA